MLGDDAKRIRVAISIDGAKVVLDPSVVSSMVEMELHRVTGETLTSLIRQLESGDVSLYAITCLAFLARRSAGENVLFDEFARSVTYGSVVDIEMIDDSNEGDFPLAPGPG